MMPKTKLKGRDGRIKKYCENVKKEVFTASCGKVKYTILMQNHGEYQRSAYLETL